MEVRYELRSTGGDVVTGYRTVDWWVENPENKSRCEDVIKMDLRIRDCGVVVVTATACLYVLDDRPPCEA